MNQKIAKRIRSGIVPADRSAFRNRRYIVHGKGMKAVRTGRVNPDGTPEMIHMQWIIVRLDPMCPRAKYQAMKAAA